MVMGVDCPTFPVASVLGRTGCDCLVQHSTSRSSMAGLIGMGKALARDQVAIAHSSTPDTPALALAEYNFIDCPLETCAPDAGETM